MYKCECGKEFEKKQSYVAHCGHCSIHLKREPVDRFGDSRAWSRGLTKETDVRVAKIGRIISEKYSGKNSYWYGRNHSEQTKKTMAEKARYNAKNHINGWKSGNSKIPNKYEKFTKDFLDSHKIPFKSEVVVPKSEFGIKGNYYQLDFLVLDKIDLEIDGSSHNENYDNERDSHINKLYQVYRIKHEDSLKKLEIELNRFITEILNKSEHQKS